MKALVIIPHSKPSYELGFSAPISWLFTGLDEVFGIFSSELTEDHIKSFDLFIIELNWHTELYEFSIIVKYIKSIKKEAKILFGGIYSQLKYKTIFEKYDIDYFIKGDNEVPIKLLLSGVDLKSIPNLVTRSFENSLEFIFKQSDYDNIDFDLSWFPSYFNLLKDEIDTDNSLFINPMIVSSKGCTTVHAGCDYCVGSKKGRDPVEISNEQLISMLRKIEKKFKVATLYVISPFVYDLKNEKFDMELHIEIDSKVDFDVFNNFVSSFRKTISVIPLYKEGIMGNSMIEDVNRYRNIEGNHEVRFPARLSDEIKIKIEDKRNMLFNLEKVFTPIGAIFDSYMNDDFTKEVSYSVYRNTIHKLRKKFEWIK